MKLSELDFVVFDVETTGLNAQAGDRIVEIAAVKAREAAIIGRYSSLVDTGVSISEPAFAVNKITEKMLQKAPGPDKVIPEFMDFAKGKALFAYNAKFDADFLKQEIVLLKKQLPDDLLIIDILAMARTLVSNLARYNLVSVAEHFGLLNSQKHRALEDAEMTLAVLLRLFNILKAKGVDDFFYVRNRFCIDRELVDRALSGRVARIQEAVELGSRLKIKYFSPQYGEVTEREVSPRTITREDNRNYLKGYCHLRSQDRKFRIDGILRLELM